MAGRSLAPVRLKRDRVDSSVTVEASGGPTLLSALTPAELKHQLPVVGSSVVKPELKRQHKTHWLLY